MIRFTRRGRAAYAEIHDIPRDIEREWSAELGPVRFVRLKQLSCCILNGPLINSPTAKGTWGALCCSRLLLGPEQKN
jgi:hypothetical protein